MTKPSRAAFKLALVQMRCDSQPAANTDKAVARARQPADGGAQIVRLPELSSPPAIGGHPREKAESGPPQHEAWELIQRSHAVANGVYVAAVNRVGHGGPTDGGLEFWGASFVSDAFGTVLQRGSHQAEEL